MSSTAVVYFLSISFVMCIFFSLMFAHNLFKDHVLCISFQQVVKFLVERNSNNALHGQVTIGTLIFQVLIDLPVFSYFAQALVNV